MLLQIHLQVNIISLRGKCSPIIINTTHHNVHFLNQFKLENPRYGTIDPKTKNNHDFCYQCYIYSPDLLFVNFSIKDNRDRPFSPVKISTIHENYI